MSSSVFSLFLKYPKTRVNFAKSNDTDKALYTLARARTAVADLTARIGLVGVQVVHLRHIDELELDAGNGETDVANSANVPVNLSRQGSGALSLTVALENLTQTLKKD